MRRQKTLSRSEARSLPSFSEEGSQEGVTCHLNGDRRGGGGAPCFRGDSKGPIPTTLRSVETKTDELVSSHYNRGM